jgi:toxin CptA
MHSAPSVTYPVGRSRWVAALLVMVWLAGVAATLRWTTQPDLALARAGGAWAALIASGFFAGWKWWAGPRGELSWVGANWAWTGPDGAATAGQLQVTLDLQRLLLVRWFARGQSRWLWLERAGRASHWDDLRRAVYSRARPEALPLREPPAAKP